MLLYGRAWHDAVLFYSNIKRLRVRTHICAYASCAVCSKVEALGAVVQHTVGDYRTLIGTNVAGLKVPI